MLWYGREVLRSAIVLAPIILFVDRCVFFVVLSKKIWKSTLIRLGTGLRYVHMSLLPMVISGLDNYSLAFFFSLFFCLTIIPLSRLIS
jgi:hypothetical protein